jgi:uncharacterized iron-regulated membrane protein
MSFIAVLVFLVVIGTIGALMVLTPMIDRSAAQPDAHWAPRPVVPAPRDGAAADAAVEAVEVVEPEAGVR